MRHVQWLRCKREHLGVTVRRGLRNVDDDLGGGGLNRLQRVGQRVGVAVVELDVIGTVRRGLDSEGAADNVGNCFRLGLADSLRWSMLTIFLVQ